MHYRLIVVCKGCCLERILACSDEDNDMDENTCPFCRLTCPSDEVIVEKDLKRASAGDAGAMYRVSNYYAFGERGVERDEEEGMKWLHRAAEAGHGRQHAMH